VTAFFEKDFESGGAFAEAAAEAADELRRDGLKDEAVLFLEESHASALANSVLAAELGGDDQLAFGGDGGNFGFHAVSSKVERHGESIQKEQK